MTNPTTTCEGAPAMQQHLEAAFKRLNCQGGEVQHKQPAVVIVDPYSSGGYLARKTFDRGYQIVRVLSQSAERMADQSLPACCNGLTFLTTIQDRGDVEGTMERIKEVAEEHNLDLAGFLCGAEPGVELFDAITSRWGGKLGSLSNGEELSHCRRDKYHMSERVREAGMRAVKQVKASTWEQAQDFIKELYPELATLGHPPKGGINVILKPVRSSSSEDVCLAHTMEDAHRAFTAINSKKNQYGDSNETVLVQEYLKGKEYVVNCISYKGQHKVVSMWQYDKRQVNGGQFVYFAVNLFESADGVIEAKLGDYIRGVLDALCIKHGPSHAEVMWLDDEQQPCLVEIASRAHGGDGVHQDLADACIGYNQLDSMIDLVECPSKFKALPMAPPRLRAHASVVILVSYESGILRSYSGMTKVRALPSFKSAELKIKPNSKLFVTFDYMTNPGWIMLVHPDAEVVKSDAATIHRMEEERVMYEVVPEEEVEEVVVQ